MTTNISTGNLNTQNRNIFKGPIINYVKCAFDSNHHKTHFLCLGCQSTLSRVRTQQRTLTEPFTL